MNVDVILTPNFEREAKKLIKKYRSLKQELLEFSEELKTQPRLGTQIKENVYKIRLAVRSKGKGKSGGMRIVTYVEAELVQKAEQTDVYLLSIYDKSSRENISDQIIEQIIDEIQLELKGLLSDANGEEE
jgi:mRNA-degrading endonuclease RelE of RelBE toxin-antitoxin system